MISSKQIKAARSLLEVSQGEVANACGINIKTLSQIEKGGDAKAETIARIKEYFISRQIEFISGGVRITENFRIYSGSEGLKDFMDDIYYVAKNNYGTICIFNGLPKKIIEYLGQDFYDDHVERMVEIKNRFEFKIIVEQKEDMLISSSFAEYRHHTKIHDRMIYVYGNRTAFISFKNGPEIVVIQGEDAAESMRTMFDAVWKTL